MTSNNEIDPYIRKAHVDEFFKIAAKTFPKVAYMFAVNFDPGDSPKESKVSVMGIRPVESAMLQALEDACVDVKGAFDEHHNEIGELFTDILSDAIDKGMESWINKRKMDAKIPTQFLCMSCKKRLADIETTPSGNAYLNCSKGVCAKYKYPCTVCQDWEPVETEEESQEAEE